MRIFLSLIALSLLAGTAATAQTAPATVDRRAAMQEGMRCLKDARPPDVSDDDRDEFCLCVAASLRESVPAQTLTLARTTAPGTDAEKQSRRRAADYILETVTVPCLSIVAESIEARRCTRPHDSKNMRHCGCVGAAMGLFVFDFGAPLMKASMQLSPQTKSPLMLLFTSGDYTHEVKKAGQSCKFKS